jgi:hypothetical protein
MSFCLSDWLECKAGSVRRKAKRRKIGVRSVALLPQPGDRLSHRSERGGFEGLRSPYVPIVAVP